MSEQFLGGSVYIGATGGEYQPIETVSGIMNLTRRPGDEGPIISAATKGFACRTHHLNKFLASEHDFILFLDSDQTFHPDTLERLRRHGKQFVSGWYLQRQVDPCVPVWRQESDIPLAKPWMHVPGAGLHRIGSSGWGCVLIHRSVFEQMRPVLKGEPFIIEDDMDVWPYDLEAVMRGEEKLRPLTGDKDDIVGSDVRFGFFARQVGVTLWGDADVRCGHTFTHQLGWDDFVRSNNHAALQLKLETEWPKMVGGLHERVHGIDERSRLGNVTVMMGEPIPPNGDTNA